MKFLFQSLIRQVALVSDRNFVTALLHFLSVNYATILEELKKHASEMLVFGGVPKPIVHIQRPPSIVVPGAQLLRGEVYEILKSFFFILKGYIKSLSC